jgi:MFS family permease
MTVAMQAIGVVVALSNIMTAFGADVHAVQWVMTGYLIARVVPMPALGWLTSVLGNRTLYTLGVLGTTVCTVLCGLAWDMPSLIGSRILQGMMGAPVMGTGLLPAPGRGLPGGDSAGVLHWHACPTPSGGATAGDVQHAGRRSRHGRSSTLSLIDQSAVCIARFPWQVGRTSALSLQGQPLPG